MCKDDANYGRPVAGSKTELRGKQAGIHISSEMVELCNIIRSLGVAQDDGSYAITFGDLFEFYTRISNKVTALFLVHPLHRLPSLLHSRLGQTPRENL